MDMKVGFFLVLAFAGLLGSDAAERRQGRQGQSSSRTGCPPIPKRDKLLCCAPNQEPGHCVPLEKCPRIRRIVEVGHTPTEAEKQLFRDSYCGGTQQNIKVCCPVVSMDSCGDGDANKVSGGVEAVPMEFPWMAVLMYRDRRGDNPFCGGSLINNRYILTAAHCVTNPPDVVRLGEHDMNKDIDCFRDLQNNSREKCAPPVRDFGVERVIPHPDYDPNSRSESYLQNDIALIRLNASVTFSEAVQPICLPLGNSFQATLTRASFRLAGWGLTNNSSRIAAHALQKLKIPHVDVADCVSRYDEFQKGPDKVPILQKSQLCAGGEKGKGSCQGDSGGPITYPGSVSTKPSRLRQVQYGIVSFGNNLCATRALPTVFTRVTNYLMWILRNLQPPDEDYRFEK